MRIAPLCRAYLNSDHKKIVDKCISHCEQNKDLLYLSLLKTRKHKPSKSDATWPVHVENDTDVIIIGMYFNLCNFITTLIKKSYFVIKIIIIFLGLGPLLLLQFC